MLYSLRIEVIADTFAEAEVEVEQYERMMLEGEAVRQYGKMNVPRLSEESEYQRFAKLIGREVTDESYHRGDGDHVVGRRKVLYKAHPDTVTEELKLPISRGVV